jgi:type IV pilus assembly protein PilC
MLFSSRLPTSSLIELCRALRHYLGAGLTLRDVFQQQSRKGSLPVRPVAARISATLERGDDLEEALQHEQGAFPPLFVSLAAVGEQTGTLPEVCHELEKYYRLQQTLWRQFWSQITWPLFQFVAATFVIAGLIWILGLIADSRPGEQPMDPLGLGLTGGGGALTFLAVVYGIIAVVFGLYLAATRLLKQKAAIDGILLRLPAIGPTLHALALARFCLALRLTTETGMPITRAVRLSLRATGNAAFADRSEVMEATLKAGDELALAVARAGVFGEEFGNVVSVGEESGRLSEVMEHQANHYEEEAGRRMHILTQVAAWGVWLFVACIIIFAIFRIAMTVYINPLNDALNNMP